MAAYVSANISSLLPISSIATTLGDILLISIIIPSEFKNCIAIPKAATYELQDRIFVYRVINGKASSTEISVSPQDNGQEYIVTSGLEVGDIIIAEGAGLIKEGTAIKMMETEAEADSLKTEEVE